MQATESTAPVHLCPIQHPYTDIGAFMDCYCCCRSWLVDCIDADPFDNGIRNNTEGIKLLEAEDNHIDKSKSRVFNRLA